MSARPPPPSLASQLEPLSRYQPGVPSVTKYRVNGPFISVYIDGTLRGNATFSPEISSVTPDYVGLVTYNCISDWRNIKLWTLSGGAPA